MRHVIHSSFTLVWRWLCLVYVCLGIATVVGCFRLGDWLPGVVPEMVWGLVWLVCAAGTWQEKYASVRGSLSILAPALSMMSYGLDFVIGVLGSPSALPTESIAALAHCIAWGSICMLIHTITRLDQPAGLT